MLLLPKLLKRSIRKGQLTVLTPDGKRHVFGPGRTELVFAGKPVVAGDRRTLPVTIAPLSPVMVKSARALLLPPELASSRVTNTS